MYTDWWDREVEGLLRKEKKLSSDVKVLPVVYAGKVRTDANFDPSNPITLRDALEVLRRVKEVSFSSDKKVLPVLIMAQLIAPRERHP